MASSLVETLDKDDRRFVFIVVVVIMTSVWDGSRFCCIMGSLSGETICEQEIEVTLVEAKWKWRELSKVVFVDDRSSSYTC